METFIMNPLKAIGKLLKLLEDYSDDFLHRAEQYEEKLDFLLGQIGDYEKKAKAFITDYLGKASSLLPEHFLADLFSDNDNYKLLKDRDLSWLYTFPQNFDFDVETQWNELIDEKISALKNFLGPLQLSKIDILFKELKEIITEAIHLPADLDLYDEGAVHAFQQLKLEQLEKKMQKLMELMLDIPPAIEPVEAADAEKEETDHQSIFSKLEEALPELEKQFETIEKEEGFNSKNMSALAKPFLELLQQLLPTDVQPSFLNEADINSFIEDLESRIRKIDFSKNSLAIGGLLKLAVYLSKKYIPSNSPFAPITEALEKAATIWGFFYNNGLLVPVRFSRFEPEEFEETEEIHIQQAESNKVEHASSAVQEIITDTQTAVEAPENPSVATSKQGNSQAKIDVNGENWHDFLLKKALQQLTEQQQELYENIADGTAFQPILNSFETLEKPLSSVLPAIIKDVEHAFKQNQLTNINQIIRQIEVTVRKLVTTTLRKISTILNDLLELLSKSLQLFIELIKKIKLPAAILEAWKGFGLENSIDSLGKIALPCLLVAMPTEILVELNKTTLQEVKNWIK